ncbi:MAG: ABC transporter permease [Lachnospiraceae bacterium]|nr:ABC transporter permease [Lachnospiraceae bacterium]
MFIENIRIALSGLRANKLRTFLTMLGIIIGIASVIAIMTVGDAMNNSVMESMGSVGANNIEFYVSEDVDADEEVDYSELRPMETSDEISRDMINDLVNKFKNEVSGVVLSESVGTTKVEDDANYANITINGMNLTALEQMKLKMLSGRTLSISDIDNKSKVCLVSDKFVDNMYDGHYSKAIGQPLEVVLDNKYYTYTIVGVYKYDPSVFNDHAVFKKKDVNTQCIIPITTAMQQVRSEEFFFYVTVVAADGYDPDVVASDISNWINKKYYETNDTYCVESYTMKADLDYLKNMVNTIKLAFMAIGAISLLVGGIGVMNIMVVTITERTREIGTRKALGATNGSIRAQFITEAVAICAIGGIIGVATGIGIGQIILKVINVHGMPSLVEITISIIFSMGIGIFFGFYPANKAAKMNPVEALRYE